MIRIPSFFVLFLLLICLMSSDSYAVCEIHKEPWDETWCYIQEGEIVYQEQPTVCDDDGYVSHWQGDLDPSQDIIMLATDEVWGWWADIIIDDAILYVSYRGENLSQPQKYERLLDFDKRYLSHRHPDVIMDDMHIVSLYYQPYLLWSWDTRHMQPFACQRNIWVDSKNHTVWRYGTWPRLQLLTGLDARTTQERFHSLYYLGDEMMLYAGIEKIAEVDEGQMIYYDHGYEDKNGLVVIRKNERPRVRYSDLIVDKLQDYIMQSCDEKQDVCKTQRRYRLEKRISHKEMKEKNDVVSVTLIQKLLSTW